MTIRNRLKLIALVPILLLLALATYFFVTSYVNYEKAQSLKTALNNNAYLSKTLAQIGKERDVTALYIGSDRTKFKSILDKQRKLTDKTIAELRAKLKPQSDMLLPFVKNEAGLDEGVYQRALNNLTFIAKIRRDADNEGADFKKVFFDEYTRKLTTPLLNGMMQINRFALNTDIAALIASLSELYAVKENSSLERGYVAYFMTKRASMAFDEIGLWDHFRTKANIFDIEQVADTELKQTLRRLLNNPKNRAMLQELSETSSAIQTDVDNGDYAEEVMDWFTLQTQKIALYTKLELFVSDALWKKADAFLQKQLMLLAISSAILLLSILLAYLGYTTTRDITRNIQELEDVLNKAIEDMKESEDYIYEEIAHIENVDLDTTEGTREAYKFLETLVQTAKEDKLAALQANEAKSLFLANMSHEIRTPLNGIVGFTEILRNTELTQEQQEFLNIIEKSSENLLSIINNILDLSKIESNKVEIENIVFDTAEEFESAVETYAVAAAEKNIDLNFYLDPSISPKLKGDPTKIKEVIINLLSNAIKFTSYGGMINVRIEKEEAQENDTFPRIKFSVQDNGIGMTKDQQERVFDAFSQADVSVTRKYGGTGLGLTISAQFVELMGGKLDLISAKDQGTTFFFSIPLEEVGTTEPNYHLAFQELTLGKYQQEIPTVLDNYLNEYFEYFGPNIKYFESVGELRELYDHNVCKNYWIDIDKAKQNIIDALSNVDKDKLIIIANVTSRSKVEDLGIDQDNIIFKPVTLTKLKNVLIRSASTTPELVEKAIQTHATHFDAKILVAEDNIINQKLIRRVLEDHGITVDIANNGLEAFEKRRNNDYDLIFMDIQMPVMDGIEATHEILDFEEDEEVEHVPIVALTANALKGDRERFLSEGMDEYITKPLETAELLYILNKFLSDKAKTVEKAADEPQKAASSTKEETVQSDNKAHTASGENDAAAPKEGKKILIAKKLPLESKLITKIIDNLGYDYDVLKADENISELIASGDYDIIITDPEVIQGKLIPKKIRVITEANTKNEIEASIKSHRG